jgi:hypothetical protein
MLGITHGFYDALARLMHTADPDARITQVGFGTGTAAAAETDTALSPDAYVRPVSAVTVSPTEPRAIRFSWRLEKHEANGLAISEIGLLTADGTLCARKVRAHPIHKTADLEIGDHLEIQL